VVTSRVWQLVSSLCNGKELSGDWEIENVKVPVPIIKEELDTSCINPEELERMLRGYVDKGVQRRIDARQSDWHEFRKVTVYIPYSYIVLNFNDRFSLLD
jgi:hypothetical protein